MNVDFTEALNFFAHQCIKTVGLNLSLDGELGAGKTFFVRHLVSSLDQSLGSGVTSPSFGLCNNYVNQRWYIDHFDLYRLEEESQLDEIGLFESLDNPNCLTLVEWVNLFPEIQKLFDFSLTISSNHLGRLYDIKSR